jgi:hypothetical protein
VNRILVAAILLAAAGPASAHGEQVAMMPIGNLLAVAVAGVIAFRVEIDWGWRVAVVLLAALIAMPPYFLTNADVPYWMAFSALAWFVVGFVPPVTVASLALLWRRKARRRKALRARS